MDGSEPRAPPVELEGVPDPVVMTKVRVVQAHAVPSGSPSAACLRVSGRDAQHRGPLVERIGVSSTTVTFSAGSGLYGCDDAPETHEPGRRWCGLPFGRLHGGALRDPRLDIAGCLTDDREPVALAWIETTPLTRYLVVDQGGYVEAYETAGSIPVRVATTTGIEEEGSRVTFRLSEHDERGRLLRREHLVARPAG